MPDTLEQVKDKATEEKVLSRGAVAEIASIVRQERGADVVFAYLVVETLSGPETIKLIEV